MRKLLFSLFLVLATVRVAADVRTLVLDEKPGVPVAETMYGLFLEDINFAADGGLYAELVENRSFDFPNPLQGWDAFGGVSIGNSRPAFSANPNYVTLAYSGHPFEATGIVNRGYHGIGLRQETGYELMVHGRLHKGSSGKAEVLVELVDEYQNVLAAERMEITSSKWTELLVPLHVSRTTAHGQLRLRLIGEVAVDLDHISLMPNDRLFFLRRDLVEALRDLHPDIFRFPGGCIVEGTQLESRYQWKNSIGPVENRPLNKNRWNNTFEGRYAPNYYQSYGLGFYEYFLLAEYIGAQPVPVVSVGLSCQFHNPDEANHAPLNKLQPYIQDALDLIEFANGDTRTKYGKIRAEMGHPEPFGLKMIAIGNEQWGQLYSDRLEPFVVALRQRYPDIEIIGSAGPFPDGQDFDFGWSEMRRLDVDYVDEHYYKNPDWFLNNATRYDHYQRKGPKVFAGEYAAHIDPAPALRRPGNKNTFYSALAEAAFMTGLERNADVVTMTAYAPLLANMNNWQWDPDLIWFDQLHVVRTANYYVQQLFASYHGDRVLAIREDEQNLTGQDGLYASATLNSRTGERFIRLVNTASTEQTVCLESDLSIIGCVRVHELHADSTAYNTVECPNAVVPTDYTLYAGGKLCLNLKPQTLYVLCVSPTPAVFPASDARINYTGRISWECPDVARFTYPGVQAELAFTGTSLLMEGSPRSGYYMVSVDQETARRVGLDTPTDSILVLADGLKPGNHTAQLMYITEGYDRKPEIRAFLLDKGAELLEGDVDATALRLEFIGNSITCGYGAESHDPLEHFSDANSNHYLSYAAETARRLHARYTTVARSGIGVYRCYDGPRQGDAINMNTEFSHTLLYQPEIWNFRRWQPHVVCINLGTNDTSTSGADEHLLQQGYERLLQQVRAAYPAAVVVFLSGSMMQGAALEMANRAMENTVNRAHLRGDEHVYRFSFTPQDGSLGYGADWHPSREQHQKMADELTEYLQTAIMPLLDLPQD